MTIKITEILRYGNPVLRQEKSIHGLHCPVAVVDTEKRERDAMRSGSSDEWCDAWFHVTTKRMMMMIIISSKTPIAIHCFRSEKKT